RGRPPRRRLPAAPLQPDAGVRRGLRSGARARRRGRGDGRLRGAGGPGPRAPGAVVPRALPPPPGRGPFGPSWSAAAPALAARARPGDLVMTMGAGDVSMVGPEVLEVLRSLE